MPTRSCGKSDEAFDTPPSREGRCRPMGSFRFRRTAKIVLGIRLNINKRSVSLSAGVRGARV